MRLTRSSVLSVVCSAALIASVSSAQESGGAAVQRMVTYTQEREPCAEYSATRMPLFGDVHVHTSFSFDAAAISIGATPTDANNFARGGSIPFWPLRDGQPAGEYKMDRPLDFLAVTDHGEFLGERRLCGEPDSPTYDSEFCKGTRVSQRQGMIMMGQVITTETPARIPDVCGEAGELCREFALSPWKRMAEAAEAANDKTSRCSFTSFVAYEYTGTPGTSNYHRNVIFRNGNVPGLPVSYIDAPYDSMLWQELDKVCTSATGCDYLTIPHNTNLANGRMAPYMRLDQGPESRTSYAKKRLEREPIMEIFQHKGASECINGLGSVLAAPDELCDVEAVRVIGREETFVRAPQLGNNRTSSAGGAVTLTSVTEVTAECGDEVGSSGMLGGGCVDASDFLRSGLLEGLREEKELGLNPIKLGVIASTDTHAATPGAADEADWRGHVSLEATPEERLRPGLLTSGIDGNPGGLAGVWAVENSRDAIFEAMMRREVFGTSGPRIVPRFFASWNYQSNMCTKADMVDVAYASGVPMGGDLPKQPSASSQPVFVASALRDPQGGLLQQLQIIKGWVGEDGSLNSEVLPVAGTFDSKASVDPASGTPTGGGHDSLCSVYRDENFNPNLHTYYYLRAVENPSARWSFRDCLRISEADRPAVCTDGSYPDTIQEMAWTSPIWYRP